jgi:hypothetical protein
MAHGAYGAEVKAFRALVRKLRGWLGTEAETVSVVQPTYEIISTKSCKEIRSKETAKEFHLGRGSMSDTLELPKAEPRVIGTAILARWRLEAAAAHNANKELCPHWVVTTDAEGLFTAQLWVSPPKPVRTKTVFITSSHDEILQIIPRWLARLPPGKHDQPNVIETWF